MQGRRRGQRAAIVGSDHTVGEQRRECDYAETALSYTRSHHVPRRSLVGDAPPGASGLVTSDMAQPKGTVGFHPSWASACCSAS